MPQLYESGWAGYAVVAASRTLSWWITHLPSTNTTSSLLTLSPFFQYINSNTNIQFTTQQVSIFPSFYPWYQTFSQQVVPPVSNFIIGTWLMPQENFEVDNKIEEHAEALIEVAERNEGKSVMVFMVTGGVVKQNAGTFFLSLFSPLLFFLLLFSILLFSSLLFSPLFPSLSALSLPAPLLLSH